MARRAFISRFSPNRTDPRVLEAIFVQRQQLAEIWQGKLRDSLLGDVKHHLLAVGPRGCGKSHLVALLVSRLRNDPKVTDRVRIAWLPEDETTPSFWKFLLRILRALNAEYGDEFPPLPHEKLKDKPEDRRTAALSKHLLAKLRTRTLLVVVENLDEVMQTLKAEGQKRWRAFLQEHPVVATLATSQRLTKSVSDRDRPFFNFFQIEHLQPLSADEALELLRKLAQQSGNTNLDGFLQTATGRARVRAIRHLAGGSHRVFIILSEFATRENLDYLVTAFEELLDELTPYYQERLRWLPDQQREIVEFLCKQVRTVQVKEIATALFLSEQVAAGQLKQLKDKGYVTAGSVGRESRYELAEPLMRLCIEVKDPQRDTIRLVVEFLRVWYDRGKMESQLGCLAADADVERRYLRAAIDACQPDSPGPVEEALDRDLEAARASGDPEEVARVLVDWVATADNIERSLLAACKLFDVGLRDPDIILTVCERAIQLNAKSMCAWYVMGFKLGGSEGLAAIERMVELDPKSAALWYLKGIFLSTCGRSDESLTAFDRAIELNPKSAGWLHGKGLALIELGRFSDAIVSFQRAIELDPDCVPTYDVLSKSLILQGNWHEAERILAQRFRLPLTPANPADSEQLPDLLAVISRVSSDRRVLAQRVTRLLEIAAEAFEENKRKNSSEQLRPNPLSTIGDALVRSLRKPAYTEAPAESLDAWAATWQEAAEHYPELLLPARLFSVGVRYLRAWDERVLLDLVQEERAILRELFGLDKPSN